MASFVIEIFGGLDREDEQLKEAEKEQPERKEEPWEWRKAVAFWVKPC